MHASCKVVEDEVAGYVCGYSSYTLCHFGRQYCYESACYRPAASTTIFYEATRLSAHASYILSDVGVHVSINLNTAIYYRSDFKIDILRVLLAVWSS